MENLVFISMLEKEDLMTVDQIKDYFKKDVTIRALKKGYAENRKFKLLLKDFNLKNKTYSICFVFDENAVDKNLQEITSEDLLKIAFLKLYEENDILTEGEL